MVSLKNILVSTTSSLEGLEIKKYLKPVTAHIVAGANLFNDAVGGLTDVFGDRTTGYQKQLRSLYNEAIERIRLEACKIGANGIVGLHINMDEVPDKGRTLVMLTAMGTAVIIERSARAYNPLPAADEKLENIGVDRIDVLREKRSVIERANAGSLEMDEQTWNFITLNQVYELFPYLLRRFADSLQKEKPVNGSFDKFYKLFYTYIEGLPQNIKLDLLYNGIKNEQNEKIVVKLVEIAKAQNLFDFNRCFNLLRNEDFQVRKKGLRLVVCDKPVYNRQDLNDFSLMRSFIKDTFQERGVRSIRKSIFSLREKEIWKCECGKVNAVDAYCNGCGWDIYGFTETELKPAYADEHIAQKIGLIYEYLK